MGLADTMLVLFEKEVVGLRLKSVRTDFGSIPICGFWCRGQAVKAAVCKTAIPRFKSGRHLQNSEWR